MSALTGSSVNRVDAPELEKTDNAKECVVCTVVVVALAGVLTAAGLYMSFWLRDTTGRNDSSTDQAGSNVTAAMVLRAYMKRDEDPCQNFYRFACGNYESASRQVLAQMEDEMYASLAQTLDTAKFPRKGQVAAAEKAAALYKACTRVRVGEVDDGAAMTHFMQDVGLTADTYASANALDKIAMLFFSYNLVSVLELSLVDTRLRRGHRVLHLALSTGQLVWLGKRGRVTAAFYTQHLGPFGLVPSSDEAIGVAQSIVLAENAALQELLLQAYAGNTAGEFIYRVSELNDVVPCTDDTNWAKHINLHSDNFYNGNDEVLVQQPDAMRFERLCRELGNEKLSLLVAWELLRTLLPLSYPSVAMRYSAESANQMCMRAVARAMEVPLLSWYLFKEVPPGAVSKAKEMADYIRKTILAEIDSATWLDGQTKQVAITKVYSMRQHVGYPKFFATPKEIDKFYSTYPDIKNSFVKPWKEAMQKTVKWITTNTSSFWFSVASTNALYMPMRNHIVIPATVLRMPLFSMAAPKAFNFGGLGAVLGHEMTHAFDPVGSRWDARGRRRDWWTASSRQLYNDRLSCLRLSHGTDQGDADAENTADFAGLVSSYDGFSNLEDTQKLEGLPYDSDQLFFISSCVKWCASAGAGYSKRYAPWWDRCNVPLKNMEDFADAFQCPMGSAMRPTQRCSFW